MNARMCDVPVLAFPMTDDAPAALWRLDGHCGPLAVWGILRYFKKRRAVEQLIRACRHTKKHGTFAIALALALREHGLSITFHSQTDPAPNRIERQCYALAERAGVVLAGAIELEAVLEQISTKCIPIFLYNTDQNNGHFSPAVGVDRGRVILPYASEAQTRMEKAELLCRWSAPDIYRQCIVVRDISTISSGST